jgi:hypothetical protein
MKHLAILRGCFFVRAGPAINFLGVLWAPPRFK